MEWHWYSMIQKMVYRINIACINNLRHTSNSIDVSQLKHIFHRYFINLFIQLNYDNNLI